MKYITICREDRQEDGTPGSYVLATRQVFDTLEEAQRHIEPISASREPQVVANLDSQWWVLTSKEIHEVVREIVAENEIKYPESFGSPPEPV